MKKAIRLFFVLFVVLCSFCFTSCENPLFIDVSKLYTVKFETNGGTPIESYRTSRIESIPTIEKTDATFVGWYTSASFSGNAITLPLDINQDTTLYAKWNQRYTVLFETNGGTEIESYKTDVIRETPQTTKRDCNLIGWYTSGTFAGEKVTFPYTLTDSVTLYAKWEPLYNASFATNGGVAISTYKVGTIASIPQTTRVGYRLVSWYLDSNFTNPVSFPYQLDSDTTFYAKWIESTDTGYSVEHYQQEGNTTFYTLKETVTFTGTTGEETSATSKEYAGFHVKTFEQKNIAADGSTIIKIYYDRNSYSVSFDANGGNGSPYTQDFYYGIPQNLVANTYTRNGYSFIGWSNSKNGVVTYTNKQRIENLTTENGETITLYAQWYSGICITSEEVQDVDLSNLLDRCVVKIQGRITSTTLNTIAEKIRSASEGIILDLSEVENLLSISGIGEKSIFYECEKLETVLFPESITTIGNYAFKDCLGIVSITIPNNVKTIGTAAFAGCTSLECIELSGIESIGMSAFSGCTNLTNINLYNIGTIGSGAFSNTGIISIRIDALTIGNAAFKKCKSLTSVIIGRRVTSLQNLVFGECSALVSVTFENTVGWRYKVGDYDYNNPLDVKNAVANATTLKGSNVNGHGYNIWYRQ